MKHFMGALGAFAVSTALILSGGSAMAASPRTTTMCDGTLPSGTYATVMATGDCAVAAYADITIMDDLVVAPGATFNADWAPSTIMIGGSVRAGAGSWLALGCTMAHGGCEDNPINVGPYAGEHSDITVHRGIVLSGVYNAALNGIEVWGNVVSTGGGAGLDVQGFIPFSLKDDVFHGNVVVNGLTTTWFGLIRSQVDGNVVFSDIMLADPDGNEIVADQIGGNLICHGSSPAPQFGDAVFSNPDPLNMVGGMAIGQCAAFPAES
ncbi:hypothetical protein RN607_07195 [Demequina capsici]|uniref:Right handed beta helix domain-containing protein n=1 Tax=Demequina capsici TaxID=3075620 RepID=A0AA96JE43_9MICO|nr:MULTISPECIES: hypothetical protein [unclassified Demequina]WNM25890.1 hypothetical protein RN606_06985 [Demequina sp. OYTSA14]WNM28786.1 hypothetical protein RN607_07195 [Demequina sp. PMTSA13]